MNNKRTILITSLIIIFILSAVFISKANISSRTKLDVSKIHNSKLSTRIYDHENNPATSLSGNITHKYIDLAELPEYVYLAFVAAEDTRFFDHNGIDCRRILGALLANIKSRSYSQGASTITQQLIKLTHLSSEKTLSRKVQEAFLALQLEKQMPKDDILEAYINVVYFGGGAYGINAASERYFSKSASELTVAEAATLAGIIKSPTNYAPHNDPEAALIRRNYVLNSMADEGFINKTELESALSTDIQLNETENTTSKYGWYIDYAAYEACDLLGISYEELLGSGYSIYTSLNTEMQIASESIMSADSNYPEEAAQGAMVVISPSNGEICAMTGGRNYVKLGLNRASSAYRQPGSLIKPISTYAAAVDKYNYLPTSAVYDIQRTYADGYMPGNAGNSYYGKTTMRFALSKSLNAATVDLADTIGISEAAAYADKFGLSLSKDDINLSLALGSMYKGVTPLEMCAAYSVLANGGTYHTPHSVRKIADRHGNIIYEHKNEPTRVISEETAFILTDMLMTAASEGTASSLKSLNMNIAAKTGTAGLSNGDTSDAWATAYTPEIVVTAWIGKDNNTNGGMAKNISGSGYAVPVCKQFFENIQPLLSNASFVMPDGLNRVLIDKFALDAEGRTLLASAATPSVYVSTELFRDISTLNTSNIWDTPEAVTDHAIISKQGESPVIQFTGTNNYAEYIIVRKNSESSDVAGIINCNYGETVAFMDTNADTGHRNIYTIIPRHSLLYDLGITLTGAESTPIYSETDGILNELSSFIGEKQPNTEIETIHDPIFR